MTRAESCQLVVQLVRELDGARRERDAESLRADRAAAAFAEQAIRLRQALRDVYRLQRRTERQWTAA